MAVEIRPLNPWLPADEIEVSFAAPDTTAITALGTHANCVGLFVPQAGSPYISNVTGSPDWTGTIPTGTVDYFDNADDWIDGSGVSTVASSTAYILQSGMCVAVVASAYDSQPLFEFEGPGTTYPDDNQQWGIGVLSSTQIRYTSQNGAGGSSSLADWTVGIEIDSEFFDLGPRLWLINRDSGGNVTLYCNGVAQGAAKATTLPTGGAGGRLEIAQGGYVRFALVDNAEADFARLHDIHKAFGIRFTG